jgi:hypothetical protein
LPEGHDKRNAPRHRVLGHAQILAPGGIVNCVVRDLSETGARLGLSGKAKVPTEFHLWLVRRKLKLRARLRWRRGDYAGVSFVGAEPSLKALKTKPNNKVVLDV